MANPEHLRLASLGAKAIRKWQDTGRGSTLDLRSANLQGAILQDTNLASSDLSNADLWEANLVGANLTDTNCARAHLRDANLTRAYISGTNLSNANLHRAILLGATFAGASLARSDLSNSVIGSTIFADVDLSAVAGLERIRHVGPSFLDIETLHKSCGKIPEEFLRGCGVREDFIAFMPSLFGTMEPIEFYSCFISYSHQDEDFCKRLHSRMRDEKLRVWFAPEDMKGGQKLHEQIDSAIRVHDKVLLVLSAASMQSNWVATEIDHARQREREEGKRVLFPIRLVPFETIRDWRKFDADTGTDAAKEIREYFIPDFSNWKDHDAFEAAFQRLLGDLKAAGAK